MIMMISSTVVQTTRCFHRGPVWYRYTDRLIVVPFDRGAGIISAASHADVLRG